MGDINEDFEIINNDIFIKLIEEEHIIIEEFNGKIINYGKNAGIEKNKYWKVLNIINNEEYYIMNCGNKIVKIDLESIDKINKYKYTWYLISCGYCVSTFNKTKIYMHSFLMNREGGENDNLSVDHINQNKLDNRLLNLRLVTQSIQNENKSYGKQPNSIYNTNRPNGMENITLPRHMEYHLEKCGKEYFVYRDKNKYIYKDKKQIYSTKAKGISALNKYNQLMEKLKSCNIKIVYG
jgi:hypothetical protein